MDAAWAYRKAYNEAKKIKDQQDQFCSQLLNGDLRRAEEEFPESPLETEALVDVLRGRVKLSIHCYEVFFTQAEVGTDLIFSFHRRWT